MNKIKAPYILFTLIILLFLLSFFRHVGIKGGYRGELWADRSGYYVYLPATIIYHFDPAIFPDHIGPLTGDGFYLDTVNNKVRTKWWCGVAYMELPFFLVAHATSLATGNPADGFSFLYLRALDLAGVFYLVMGLYLLYLSLKIYFNFKNKITVITLLLTFAGTNLYYYSISEPGMSHVYSFFLFSCLLYMVGYRVKFTSRLKYHILLSFVVWLIFLVRPLNIIFIPVIFFWNTTAAGNPLKRFTELFHFKILLAWIATFLIVFIPQMMYWKYISGSYLHNSYSAEGFTNWRSPKIIEVLFAPHNGLLPYSLLVIFMISGLFLFIRQKRKDGTYILITFISVLYLSASWWAWDFGCSCGQRNFVEYYSILSFPLCLQLNKIFEMQKAKKVLMLSALLVVGLIGWKINYHFRGCYTMETWNWDQYFSWLTKRL